MPIMHLWLGENFPMVTDWGKLPASQNIAFMDCTGFLTTKKDRYDLLSIGGNCRNSFLYAAVAVCWSKIIENGQIEQKRTCIKKVTFEWKKSKLVPTLFQNLSGHDFQYVPSPEIINHFFSRRFLRSQYEKTSKDGRFDSTLYSHICNRSLNQAIAPSRTLILRLGSTKCFVPSCKCCTWTKRTVWNVFQSSMQQFCRRCILRSWEM